ncbi:MAG: hypothetical protein H0V44_02695 [Planctomycetes bacterium]|nr:hypothetical protein [Planctomycetota bacterium]
MPRPAIPLWCIDDSSEHQSTAEATVALMPRFSFAGYIDAEEAIEAYARSARLSLADLPRIVLMDFYLGEVRGDAVTATLRELQPATSRLTIVGYSSVAAGSERIIAAGGDIVVRKHRDGEGRNPSLLRFLQDVLSAEPP